MEQRRVLRRLNQLPYRWAQVLVQVWPDQAVPGGYFKSAEISVLGFIKELLKFFAVLRPWGCWAQLPSGSPVKHQPYCQGSGGWWFVVSGKSGVLLTGCWWVKVKKPGYLVLRKYPSLAKLASLAVWSFVVSELNLKGFLSFFLLFCYHLWMRRGRNEV